MYKERNSSRWKAPSLESINSVSELELYALLNKSQVIQEQDLELRNSAKNLSPLDNETSGDTEDVRKNKLIMPGLQPPTAILNNSPKRRILPHMASIQSEPGYRLVIY